MKEMSHTPGGARAYGQTVRQAAAAHVRAQVHTHLARVALYS